MRILWRSGGSLEEALDVMGTLKWSPFYGRQPLETEDALLHLEQGPSKSRFKTL